jgi:activator of HSP90 ATPase
MQGAEKIMLRWILSDMSAGKLAALRLACLNHFRNTATRIKIVSIEVSENDRSRT